MSSGRTFVLALLLALSGNNADTQDLTRHHVVPLNRMPSEQWVERCRVIQRRPARPL
jgi:hypothetical protein